MTRFLVLSIRFLDGRYHGLTNNGTQAEWPPSPFRLFQALVAGNSRASELSEPVRGALTWLESLEAPDIFSPPAQAGRVTITYVPNNTIHLNGTRRTPKFIRPTQFSRDRLLQYVWSFDDALPNASQNAGIVVESAKHIRCLGWGIDLAIGHGEILDRQVVPTTGRVRYRPGTTLMPDTIELRVPRRDSLTSLERAHADFTERYESAGVTVLESAAAIYKPCGYRVDPSRPYRIFELRKADGRRFRYPPRKLIHIAGMVRHLAIRAMKKNPPHDVDKDWAETYVAGHATEDGHDHRQLSYLPLPSIGHAHADPGVRRVMIAAPMGDEGWLDHLARHLAGRMLKPLQGNEFANGDAPLLVPAPYDNIARFYTQASNVWASVTPVILPGHDDRKPAKRRRLIEKALAQSGIEQPCEFEWSAISHFPKSFSAHKYDRDKRPVGYFRPGHLLSQTAVHLMLRFDNDVRVPGPMTIGAGRHCGFGLMAGIDEYPSG